MDADGVYGHRGTPSVAGAFSGGYVSQWPSISSSRQRRGLAVSQGAQHDFFPLSLSVPAEHGCVCVCVVCGRVCVSVWWVGVFV